MTTERKQQIETECVIMFQSAAKIAARDCAAFSVLIFNEGEVPDEWREPSGEAMRKFVQFGWCAFHALGGLSTDWDRAAANALAKMRGDLPVKTPQEAQTTEQPAKPKAKRKKVKRAT